jgi:hypothetical protein
MLANSGVMIIINNERSISDGSFRVLGVNTICTVTFSPFTVTEPDDGDGEYPVGHPPTSGIEKE